MLITVPGGISPSGRTFPGKVLPGINVNERKRLHRRFCRINTPSHFDLTLVEFPESNPGIKLLGFRSELRLLLLVLP